jgi:hypothetical protein
MLEVMSDSDRDALGLRAVGKLTRSDYRNVLVPTVESLLGTFGSLKVLLLLEEGFQGWSLRAAWANTQFDIKHRNDFGKVAVVGAPRWERWCVNVAANCLMSGELRTYDRADLAAAWRWVHK